MNDIEIRIEGAAGCISLNRPKALNALTYQMCLDIEAALDAWATDDAVKLLIIDAKGEKAFCAGGDIAEMYATGSVGDFEYGRQFWADEYRMNAKLFEFPKPVVSFLQGFTMGGGVGVGCHGSHRIVCETSQIAMPEAGIGLVPDVGGSMILANAPGRLGEYLGTTTERMGPADAILVGFADYFIEQDKWDDLKAQLRLTDDVSIVETCTAPAPEGTLETLQPTIDFHFAGETLNDILRSLGAVEDDFTRATLKKLNRHSPLAMTTAVQMIHRLRGQTDIRRALDLEYRFTARSMEFGDFIEGIRAAIIDKDRDPKWKHALGKVPPVDVSKMLLPVKGIDLFKEKETHMRIGFIGLGNMGGPMAANLIAAGHSVLGFDTHAAPEGIEMAASAEVAVQDADVVITMLPKGDILRSVAEHVIPNMKRGAVLLDCSTVDVQSARDVAQLAMDAGCLALDAPVSGGIGGASAGTLTFMVGGSEGAFKVGAQLFDIMGQKAVHCGPSGNGQAAKICNNMILGITMIGTCEAFALADKLGLDRQAMFDVVSTSSGYSWSMNAYCPAPGVGPQSPADNDYAPGFAADLMLKDLRLSQQAAHAANADTPLGHAATTLYETFVEGEDGAGKDFSAMLPRFEKRTRSE